jgi:hypothetical protein
MTAALQAHAEGSTAELLALTECRRAPAVDDASQAICARWVAILLSHSQPLWSGLAARNLTKCMAMTGHATGDWLSLRA